MNIKELIKHLVDNYNLNDSISYNIWSVGDIEAVADDIGVELTEDEKIEIVNRIEKYKSAETGTNWGVIVSHIRDLEAEKEKKLRQDEYYNETRIDCIFFSHLKVLPIGSCSNRHSDHGGHILSQGHLPCKCFYNRDQESKKTVHGVILYGGTKKQIEKQLSCNHHWHGPCIDDTSRYHKCTRCFCLLRNMSEEEYYNKIGLESM